MRDIRCRADNGHVLCNLGVSRVPFFPKVRVTLKTETGPTQNRIDMDKPKTTRLQQPKKQELLLKLKQGTHKSETNRIDKDDPRLKELKK